MYYVVVAQGIKNGIGITSLLSTAHLLGAQFKCDSGEAILTACDLAIKDNNPLVAFS